MRQIVLDTSTTGIEPEQGHRVVEIAALELVDGKRTGQVFHQYLNPDRELEREFIQTTALTTEFLWAQPRFYEVASSLLASNDPTQLAVKKRDRDAFDTCLWCSQSPGVS